MPQAARKDVAAQRAQDKESKRARGAMSCAECRRLKLKCDKTVPCSSCKRRGCAQICPNGSLITGQGTRFVLADTEKLHQKISTMSDRIRQLEDALSILQSSVTREPHPLLDRDLLKIKSSIELHSAAEGEGGIDQQEEVEESQYIDAFGTLAIRDDGAATFYGRSAGSESLLIGEPNKQSPGPSHLNNSSTSPWQPGLPAAITNLASAFPLPASGINTPEVDLDYLVDSFLPPWLEAWRLCDLYLEQAPWFFGAVTKRQILEELLPMWYQEASSSNMTRPKARGQSGSPFNPAGSGNSVFRKGGAHDLALLFVIFCFGALTDISLPPAPDNPDSDQYFQLTRAALSLEPVLERPPSVATVQALSMMAIYQGLCSGDNSIESTWALMGMATKLAQSIGLHRDCARWKLSPAEVQQRRALFWELFITDGWQSLATGRLATFSLPFVDCELPYDPDSTIADDGTVQPSFPFWKARFGAECVSAVVQGTTTSRAPKYSVILELDRKIRDMELPKYAYELPPEGAGLQATMLHFMPINYRELTLLYVHRCFFAQAISSHPNDPIKSQYAPSFLAGYRCACSLIDLLKLQFSLFPAQIARFWVLWTHAFSSAVMLSSVVIHCPRSKVAPAALLELRAACELFGKAAAYGGRAGKFLPILQRLQQKAHQIYLDSHNGSPPPMKGDIFASSPKNKGQDELSIFSGKTHTVVTKTVPSSRSSRSSKSKSPPVEPPPSHNYTSAPAFAGVHPSLVDQLHSFDGHIHAQIQNAYHVNHDEFALMLMENRPPAYGAAGAQEHRHAHTPRQEQMRSRSTQQHQRSPTDNYSPAAHEFMQSSSSSSLASTPHLSDMEALSSSGYWPDTRQPSYPEQQYSHSHSQPQYQQQQQQQQQPMHHYPQHGAQGVVADDVGLQEKWASFMYQVGSPRPFID